MGFPSPAADYMDEKISLDHELIRVPSATYFLRAATESRREAIKKGALLILDTSATPVDGSIGCAICMSKCACCGCVFIRARGWKNWTGPKKPTQ